MRQRGIAVPLMMRCPSVKCGTARLRTGSFLRMGVNRAIHGNFFFQGVRVVDRYCATRELGAGRMATAYLAYDLKHERDVANNALHPDLGAALGGERHFARFAAPPACSTRTRDRHFNRSGATIRRAYDATADRVSTDWRVAKARSSSGSRRGPPTRRCAREIRSATS